MMLLIIVAALLVGHFMHWPQPLRGLSWYSQHLDWLSERVELRGVIGLLLALALPVVAVLIVQAMLAHGAGLVLGAAFAWFVLLVCLGPGNLLGTVNDCLDALNAEDVAQAAALREQLQSEAPVDQHPLAVGVVNRAHDEYFAVIFWFALLGPVGAVLYRATRVVASLASGHESLRAAAEHLQGMLGWPSARLTAFGFALMGNFDKALFKLSGVMSWPFDLLAANRGLLAEVIGAALDLQPDTDDTAHVLQRVRDLLLRTFTLWLVVLALLTLLGW